MEEDPAADQPAAGRRLNGARRASLLHASPFLRRPAVLRGRRSAFPPLDSRRPRPSPAGRRAGDRRVAPQGGARRHAGFRHRPLADRGGGAAPRGLQGLRRRGGLGPARDEGSRLQQRPPGEGDPAALGARRGVGRDPGALSAAGPPRGPRRQRRHPGGGDRGAGDRGPLPGGGRQARSGPGEREDRLLRRQHASGRKDALGIRRGGPRARRGRHGGGEARRGGGARPLDRHGQQPHPAHRRDALRGRGRRRSRRRRCPSRTPICSPPRSPRASRSPSG